MIAADQLTKLRHDDRDPLVRLGWYEKAHWMMQDALGRAAKRIWALEAENVALREPRT